MYVLEYIFRHFLKICLKVHDWCCWKCVSYSAGPLCLRLDLDMIYEINTKLISKALLSVFCQVFCYFYCRNAKKRSVRCYLLCAYYPWNLLTGEICLLVFFGKPYFCLQHAIIQCYLFTVEIFFKHCEELVFSSGLTFNCTVMKYLNRELQRVDRVVCFGWGGIPQKRRHSTLNDQRNVHTYTQQAYFK